LEGIANDGGDEEHRSVVISDEVKEEEEIS